MATLTFKGVRARWIFISLAIGIILGISASMFYCSWRIHTERQRYERLESSYNELTTKLDNSTRAAKELADELRGIKEESSKVGERFSRSREDAAGLNKPLDAAIDSSYKSSSAIGRCQEDVDGIKKILGRAKKSSNRTGKGNTETKTQ